MTDISVDEQTLEISHQLQHILRQKIKDHAGFISFATWMELALYAPQWGYYHHPRPKIGADGDFITAPEISPLFSQCLAHYCQPYLRDHPQTSILELGAGNGTMAKDLLTALHADDCLPHTYFILEISPSLRHQQTETLSTLPTDITQRIQWLNKLPPKLNGIILANEVIDAMPVHCFEYHKQQWHERGVGDINGEMQWQTRPASGPLLSYLEQLVQTLGETNFSDGYQSEACLSLSAWINSLSDTLQQGLMVFIDYGHSQQAYYHPQRNMGTLTCHCQHQAHDNPLLLPGTQDITAHANFSDLANAAQTAKLDVQGYTTQAQFLLNNQILDFAQQSTRACQREIQQLTHPGIMGERFKVMTLSRGIKQSTEDFLETINQRDLRYQL
jgi:SAM-dependent MidA family methyltransferase